MSIPVRLLFNCESFIQKINKDGMEGIIFGKASYTRKGMRCTYVGIGQDHS